jgi:hypothetical protein
VKKETGPSSPLNFTKRNCCRGHERVHVPLKVNRLSLSSHFKVILGRYTEVNIEIMEVQNEYSKNRKSV